jgi:alpha-D-xyloside xylohydrolase
MKVFFFLLAQLCVHFCLYSQSSFTRAKDGIIVYTNDFKAVKLEVVTDHILRVIAAPGRNFTASPRLITDYPENDDLSWKVASSGNIVTLKTKFLAVKVNAQTGSVSFFDKDGKPILAEKASGGREFRSVVLDGKPRYQLTQSFQLGDKDACYGLGQHQSGIMNFKGQQVNFFQNNTEVAIPFLISNNNYGILWDNYSITKVGDVRPLLPLSTFQLFSKTGEEGWLTASYSNNKSIPGDIVIERPESDINMEFLGDSKIQLPKEFMPETGMVTWEGSLSSYMTGVHRLQFIFGGTLRVWLDNQLVMDRWRKAWNPARAVVPVNIESSRKIPVRIEWIPEGGASYISLKWQRPLTAEDKNTFSFSSEAGKQIDYYFIYGKNMDSVISGYRQLTGKAPIVPKWALGFWQSRERYKTEDEVLSTVGEFRRRKIPLDNIVLDWNYWRQPEWGSQEFDETRFPSPDSMIDVLHKKYNAQIMISVWPKFYEGIPTYNEFNKNGWLYKRNIADRQRDWIGNGYISTFYDAFNADARKGFWNMINKKLFSKGIDAWWMDASEPDILSNVSADKRILQMTPTALGSAAEYLNAYPLQNAKGIYEGQRETNPDKRVFLLTRSAFAGSQRYAASVWSGDIGSTWDDMKNQITAGVDYSMSGLPYWTMDIGGFVVPEKFEKPNAENLEEWRELMTRWSQFGAFVPLFRIHGQFPYREIFNTAPPEHPAYKSFVYYDKLRYRLLPYIYSLAGAAYHDNYTIMRGLPMDFGQDTSVLNITDQYMFGGSLLINPVCDFKTRSRRLYLPKCAGWYDLYTGKYYPAGQTIEAGAPYEKMPVFVKAGSIIPFGPDLQYTSEKPADTITLNVYTGADAHFNLYEDEGTNYNYEKGKYAVIPFAYNERSGTITIEKRIGGFDGMSQRKVFRLIVIAANKPKPLETEECDRILVYNGEKLTIKI